MMLPRFKLRDGEKPPAEAKQRKSSPPQPRWERVSQSTGCRYGCNQAVRWTCG